MKDDTLNEKFEIPNTKEDNMLIEIINQIKNEQDFFKILSLYEQYHLSKLIYSYPLFKYANLIKILKSIFNDYNNHTLNDKKFKKIEKIVHRLDEELFLNKFLDNLSLSNKEKILLNSYYLASNTISIIMVMLYLIKQQINVIFEYDYSFIYISFFHLNHYIILH